MRNKKIGRILCALLALVLLAGAGYLTELFWLGAARAGGQVEDYIRHQYGREENVSMSFDWKNWGGYYGNGYQYHTNSGGGWVTDRERSNGRNDPEQAGLAAAAAALEGQVRLGEGDLAVRFLAGEDWTECNDLYLWELVDRGAVQEGQSVARGREVLWALIQNLEDYPITGLSAYWFTREGVYKYSVGMGTSSTPLTRQDLDRAGEPLEREGNSYYYERWEELFR